MDPARHARDAGHLGRIDEEREGIRWVELHPEGARSSTFVVARLAPVLRTLWREIARAELVHGGISHDLFRPFEAAALLLARLRGRKTICVVDIDLRNDAAMNFATGRWSRKSLLLCRAVYDPLRRAQLALAARCCSLVLLKGRALCRDFGRDRPHVKYFLDAAFSDEHLLPAEALAAKLRELEDPGAPLELVYFGRLTAYKGVDRCIEAVACARSRTRAPLRFHVIGTGEEAAALRALADARGLADVVEFHGALPFGPQLFAALRSMHLSLAAPLSEDTPRSALDAMASGIPILAFDTEYYADIAASGAVDLVPWPSVERMAEAIVRVAEDKAQLAPRVHAALTFARENTQERWLGARVDWTLALFGRGAGPDRVDVNAVQDGAHPAGSRAVARERAQAPRPV